jgi:hypothetical protein
MSPGQNDQRLFQDLVAFSKRVFGCASILHHPGTRMMVAQ